MQTNDLGLKRKILFDNEEIKGLVSSGPVRDEEGTVEVPSFNRKIPIKDGVKMLQPIECVYKVDRDSEVIKFMHDWFLQNQLKDVTIINTDATGQEVDRWLLPDCENGLFDDGRDYDAAGVTYYGVMIRITCSGVPERLDP